MADSARALKVAGTIKRVVAGALDTEIKDPRLGFVTVTEVRMTGDLQQASVFYTVYGDEEDRVNTAAALASSKGRLRALVGRELSIRLTPTLDFYLDSIPDTAASLERTLAEAAARDAELLRLREGATYAGDADPYRHADDDQDDTPEPPAASGSSDQV